jgi:Flp pilus assembly pilin Flp
MSLLATLMKQYARDEKGAALVEYAVIFAVLIAGTVTAVSAIGPELTIVFDAVAGAVTTLATNAAP